MDCPFQVGDEVTLSCKTDWKGRAPRWMFWRRWRGGLPGPAYGEIVTVSALGMADAARLPDPTAGDLVVLRFKEWGGEWFSHIRFRKVERKTDKLSLTEWLSQPSGDTDRLDKTRPAKTRERA